MDKIKCYIYGAGEEYNRLSSYLALYQEKLEILGIVTTYRQNFATIDGKRCITPHEMEMDEMDYVIIAVLNWKEVYDYLKQWDIEDKKILRSCIFYLPDFNLEKYLKLKRSNVSILSNDCLGGIVYKILGLKALSPTKNMACKKEGKYLEFLANYKYYLTMDMEALPDTYADFISGDQMQGRETFVPKGAIDGKIVWCFSHSENAKDGVGRWNKKREIVNFDNIAALMILNSDEEAKQFAELPIEKKLGFYYKDLHLKSVMYSPEWEDETVRFRYQYQWVKYVQKCFVNQINWIKFLIGENDFVRYK